MKQLACFCPALALWELIELQGAALVYWRGQYIVLYGQSR